ncbi:MAG: hypothetical protein ACJA08_003131 [Cyclobacteriaceae bacterium]|jgi:hypothetical protein
MNRLTLIIVISFFATCGFAQQYQQSAGIRLGHTSGLTYKKFIHEEEAIELLLSGRKNGMQLTGLYTFHHPMEVSFNENFYVYYGIGAHLGYEKYGNLRRIATSFEPRTFAYEQENYFLMGADAILGVEYRWLSVPVTVGLDIKPYFNFIGMRYSRVKFWDTALSIKYVF